jgi:prepilin-type N-terminal cleavage/methylation domain-containing protein/prepilin-type processing-associated H-X9-DG protein
MNSRSARPETLRHPRRGFTVVELVVVLSVVALLMSLIAPAVLRARGSARRMDCQNRMRNVAMAMHGFVDVNQRYPATALFGATGDLRGNWVVQLLPFLDQSNVRGKWDLDRPAMDPANQVVSKTSIPVLACPSDLSAVPGNGNLSYTVNGGIGWTVPLDCPVCLHASSLPAFQPLDLNGNGIRCPAMHVNDGSPTDRELFAMLGLFFVENWPLNAGTMRHYRIDEIEDGTTHTLCLAENVRAGFDPDTGDTWSSANPRRISFFFSGYVCEDGSCSAGKVDYARANDRVQSPYNLEAINTSISQAEGEAPWPSSYHEGGVNVAFCDGRVKFLSELVDGRVYASLISPRGSLVVGPLAQSTLSDADY